MKRFSLRRIRVNITSWTFLIPIALLVVIPFLWMLTASLKPRGFVGEPPYLFPTHFQFENYKIAWQAAPFLRYYANTTFVAICVVISRIIFSSMAAFACSILKFKGRDLIFLAFLGTMMIPTHATLIPSFLIISKFNWLNTYQAMIVPRMVDAFSIFLLRQVFITIPKDYIEAARLDGCSNWRLLWRIIIPMSRSTLSAMALFSFLFIWNDFLWPLLVANDQKLRTIQVGLQSFSGQYLTEWSYMMAGTVTAVIIPILVYFIAQKQFISGLSRSGLKG